MVSFLITIHPDGDIHRIYWSVPVYIVPMHQSSFVDLFHAGEKDAVLGLIERCMNQDAVVVSETGLRMNNEDARIMISLLRVEDQVCVFAQSEGLSFGDAFRTESRETIHRFMKIMKSTLTWSDSGYDSSARFQLDKIQILNSELVNTKRTMEKLNAQLKKANADLSNRLVKDHLTGLVSRYQYRAEMELVIATNPGTLGVFTFLDIDNFKAVNDAFGHAAGDSYLIEFADRLKRLQIDNTVKMRISGDEFGLFTYGLREAGASTFQAIWDQIAGHVLCNPIDVGETHLPVSVSAGMSVFGMDTGEIYELIDFADYAMYCAKKNGKHGYQVFSKVSYDKAKSISEKS